MTDDAIALAERILQLLDQGAFNSTYKYAVLLGLLDLCLERSAPDGTPPAELTTRELAEKVIELYWGHTVPYAEVPGGPAVLRQNHSRPGTQAEIVRRIQTFRCDVLRDSTLSLSLSLSLPLAKRAAQPAFERVVDFVEWKLIEMPLPRLQTIGGQQDPFLYRIGWSDGVRRSPVADYQSGRVYDFDNRIRLFPGVAAQLVALNGLLRPLIQRQWAQDVARINRLPEARLHAFLFGAARTPTRAIRTALVELQHGRCFYCAQPVGGGRAFDVDHFIPWSRHPDDGIENLVAADRSCNRDKRAHLAATAHVLRWVQRNTGPQHADLATIASDAGWESRPERTLGAASSIYLRLPDDFALWLAGDRFERPARAALQRVLSPGSL